MCGSVCDPEFYALHIFWTVKKVFKKGPINMDNFLWGGGLFVCLSLYAFECWYVCDVAHTYIFTHILAYLFTYIYIYEKPIGLVGSMFTNGSGDWYAIKKWYLRNTQHYKLHIKCKIEQFRERVAPSPTYWYSCY